MINAQHIKICLELVEEKFGGGSHTEWTKRYYIDLAEDISNQSKIKISYNTIIRLFERSDKQEKNHNPHKATLDALSLYLGYKNWKSFTIEIENKKPKKSINRKIIKQILIYSILIISISSIILFTFKSTKNKHNANLSITESVSSGTPYTAFFHIDLSNLKHDSAFIDFDNWEKPKQLTKTKDTLTTLYIRPGYYNPKILVKNEQIASCPIHVVSDYWYYWVKSVKANKFSEYKKLDTNSKYLYIPNNKISELGFDTNYSFKVEYFFAKEWNINMDEMKVFWRFKNSSSRPCKDSYLMMTGANGLVLMRFYAKGCSWLVETIIGDSKISGKEDVYKEFTTDIENWQEVILNISNDLAVISLNNKDIFKTSYSKSMGELKYIHTGFSGSGMVDKIEINSNNENYMIFNLLK
jgi:hypothetical protein